MKIRGLHIRDNKYEMCMGEKIKGKCAKVVTVNLKMGTYNSDKFKGEKLYTVNQNGAKVTSLLGRVKRTFSDMTPPLVNDMSYI